MNIFNLPHSCLTALALLMCSTSTQAHSWVEMLRNVDSTGTFTGSPGYPRGFVSRTLASGAGNPAWSDFVAQWKVPPDGRSTGSEILKTDSMCAPAQSVGNQTAGFPTLSAAPGDYVALQYAENGHVTLNLDADNLVRPEGNGTVWVYGTKSPSNNDTYLAIHRVWNTEGTGGDGRGKLLATRSFDDTQCYQINDASPISVARQKEFKNTTEQLCQNDIQIPQDAGSNGTYTLYWVWEYPHLNNQTGALATNESYTTCMDITLTSKSISKNVKAEFKQDQPVGWAAVQPQIKTAIMVNPTASLIRPGYPAAPLNQAANGSASGAAAATSSAVVTAASSPSVVASNGGARVTVTVTQTVHDGTATVTSQAIASSSAAPVSASSMSVSVSVSSPPTTLQTQTSLFASTSVYIAPSVITPDPIQLTSSPSSSTAAAQVSASTNANANAAVAVDPSASLLQEAAEAPASSSASASASACTSSTATATASVAHRHRRRAIPVW